MAREAGAEDHIKLENDVYYIAINDQARLTVKTDAVIPNQPLLSASLSVPVLSASTAQTTLTKTQHFVVADATDANFGIVLPSAAEVAGRTYTVTKVDAGANIVYLSGASTDKINGSAEIAVASVNESVSVLSDGVGWRVVAYHSGTFV